MFKLSRFRQERFIQELCCSSFATATASRPYSGLGTSSCALGWDPGSTAAAGRAPASHIPDRFSPGGTRGRGTRLSLAEAVGHEAFKDTERANSLQFSVEVGIIPWKPAYKSEL